jgi:hypothetical protein
MPQHMKTNRITPVILLCLGVAVLLIWSFGDSDSQAGGSDRLQAQGADATATSTATPASLIMLPLVVHSRPATATPTATPSPTPTATATATATATPTSTATPTPACSDPIYVTNFATPDGRWPSGSDSSRSYGTQSGQYQVNLKTSNVSFSATPGLVLPQDFRISVNAQVAAGSGGAYGLVFGVRTVAAAQEYYLFAVQPDSGQYSLERRDLNGSSTTLIAWTANAAILSGTQVNTLRVDRIGSQIQLYANGALLQAFADSGFTGAGRDAGVWARSYNSAPVDTRFDLFRVGCGSNTLFFDGFADTASGWPIGSDANAVWHYVNGEYEYYFNTAKTGVLKTPWVVLPANYSVEVDARQASANTLYVGLAFDMIWSGGQYAVYEFLIEPASGYYMLQKRNLSGQWTTLIDWTPDAVINLGNATNRLRVERIGADIWLYVNDWPVDLWDDGEFAGIGHDAGLRAYTDLDAPAEARFDNFRVTILP